MNNVLLPANDEILLGAILVMMIASTYMAYCLNRSLRHSRKAFEALIRDFASLDLELTKMNNRLDRLETRA